MEAEVSAVNAEPLEHTIWTDFDNGYRGRRRPRQREKRQFGRKCKDHTVAHLM